jgi:hypothetical protein
LTDAETNAMVLLRLFQEQFIKRIRDKELRADGAALEQRRIEVQCGSRIAPCCATG